MVERLYGRVAERKEDGTVRGVLLDDFHDAYNGGDLATRVVKES
jgi:hypothetical protein